ncbi:MAG: MFS transporter, partial [Comamonadaceae bacterium]
MQTFARGTPSRLRSAFDAALIMAIGMGFGRFAFTAIYPHMVQEGVL